MMEAHNLSIQMVPDTDWTPFNTTLNSNQFHVRQLCHTPRLYLVHNFLSDEECDLLVNQAKNRIEASTVVDRDSGKTYTHPGRTSSGMFFQRAETELIHTIEHRIFELTSIPAENGEGIQVLNYKPDQFYKPHYDFFDPALSGSGVHLARGGQRVATVLMYLNHVESGGETALPNIGVQVMPQKGTAFLFFNCMPNGMPDPETLHSSESVRTGEKWVATKWIRERGYH